MEQKNMNAKKHFNLRNVLRALQTFCMVCVFCPTFLVSCSGQEKTFSAMDAVGGITSRSYGQLVPGKPVFLLLLVLPVLALAVLGVKKLAALLGERGQGGVVAGLSAANLLLWGQLNRYAADLAAENLCSIKTTGWYTLNRVALVAAIALAGAVALGKLRMSTSAQEVLDAAAEPAPEEPPQQSL